MIAGERCQLDFFVTKECERSRSQAPRWMDLGPSDLLRAHVVPSTARTAPYLAARVSVFEYGGTYKRGVGEWVGGWV